MQIGHKASNKKNWSVQLDRPAGPSSWSVQLVHPAGPSSWSIQLVRPALPTSRPIYTLHLTHSILHNAPCTLPLTHCLLHIASYALNLTQCLLRNMSYIFHKFLKPLFEKSLRPLFQKSLKQKSKRITKSNNPKRRNKYVKFRNLSIADKRLYKPLLFDKLFSVLDDLCQGKATPFQ